jgi:capsular polysaccharide export protein
VIDDLGIYFDATRPSRLERLLMESDFSDDLLVRAAVLRKNLIAAKLTKYNVGAQNWSRPANAQRVILVPGQVDNDASLRYGAPAHLNNEQLLKAVRVANPDALVIYKEHPDVTAGLRQGKASRDTLQTYCDVWLEDTPMAALLEVVDEVHTITSLAGFEALIRNKRVVCYGQPFYAGWGLTTDMLAFAPGRRDRVLSINALVAATLILYPRYISRHTGRFIEVETALEQLLQWQATGVSTMPMWRQALRKVLIVAARIRGR